VTFEGTRLALERALRKRLEQTFYMVGPAMSAYMLCDWQLWLWREGLTAVFANFKLDSFHEAFVKKFGIGVIPADEEGFAHWWHDLLPDLPPRLANECIWLAVEKKLVDPWTVPIGGPPTNDDHKIKDREEVKEEMRQILIGRAKQRQTIPYTDLVAQIKAIDLPRNSPALWNMLGEISTEEDAAGRGMLTVIVVHGQGDTLPGAGFFKLARRLGRHVSDKTTCWVEELRRVHGYWAKDDRHCIMLGKTDMGEMLVIIPCGQSKVWDDQPDRGPVKARDAYTGTPFRMNRAYAEAFASRWVILSAKYGFISPDFLIPGPYNVTFKKRATNPVGLTMLIAQIKELRLDEASRIIGLGGKEYRAMIERAFAPFDCSLVFPFSGLPIGLAMQATKNAIQTGSPLGERSHP